MANSFSLLGGTTRTTRRCLVLISAACGALAVALAAAAARRRRRRLELDDGGVPACDALGVLLGDWPLLHLLAHRGFGRLLRAALPFSRPGAAASPARWTALHLAASAGHAKGVALLLRARGEADVKDAEGHTALAMAAARGHTEVAVQLLEARADANAGDRKGATPLHLAARRGDATLVSALIGGGAEVEAKQTRSGTTPLLAACAGPCGLPALRSLLEARAEANAACQGRKTTSLMLLAEWGRGSSGDGGGDPAAAVQAAKLLLEWRADPALLDHFGLTALHQACRIGAPELVAALCAGGASPSEQDNDGNYPLQNLCQRCAEHAEEEPRLVDVALRALLAAEPRAATLLDFGDASALHSLCQFMALRAKEATSPGPPPLRLLRALLTARADVSLVEEGGWTAAHFLAEPAREAGGAACGEALAVLRAEAPAAPGFWEGLDLSRPRDRTNAKYLARRGGHHRLPPEARLGVLRGEVSLAGVAARLREGRSRRVVALIGAGASTSAGIPDFRSEGGLWTAEATRDLFSGPGFVERPEVFWRKASELFEGRRPTKVHGLLAAMHSRGLLLRVYTQNVDGLEEAAGLPGDVVVDCHGSMRRAVCCANAEHPPMAVKDIVADVRRAEGAGDGAWKAPRCAACGELMCPDVVFFGQSLPEAYHRHWSADLGTCDLLLVIGTSLMVYPVAGLVKQVGPLVPRLLINRERAGVWRERGSESYRDACWEGECDAGAEELARQLGWTLP